MKLILSKHRKLIQKLDHDGYVIIRRLIDPLLADEVARDLEPRFRSRGPSQGNLWGKKTTRIESVLTKSKRSHALVLDPTILELAAHYLRPNCSNFHLNLTQGIRIHPGERAQVPHKDSSMYPIDKTFDFMVNVIWPLSNFTKQNGATFLAPGSHRSHAEVELPRKSDLVYAEMQPGDALFYRSSLTHGGGANQTHHDRTGLAVSYSLGWLRQSENMYLTYPPPVARDFPEELQSLIGYNVHKPNLGWAFSKDPAALLNDDDEVDRGAEEFITRKQSWLMKGYYLLDKVRP